MNWVLLQHYRSRKSPLPLQNCLQANLMEAIFKLEFPLPRLLSFVSSYQTNEHQTNNEQKPNPNHSVHREIRGTLSRVNSLLCFVSERDLSLFLSVISFCFRGRITLFPREDLFVSEAGSLFLVAYSRLVDCRTGGRFSCFTC